MGRLHGKVALITGAGCMGPGWGNGHAACVRFAEEGARIFAADLRADPLEETIARTRVAEGRDGAASVRRHAPRLGRRNGRGMHRAVRADRHSGQQCRRLGQERDGGDGRGRLGRAGRFQPQIRLSGLPLGATGDGGAGIGGDREHLVDLGLAPPKVEARLADQRAGGDVDAPLAQRVARIPLVFMGDGRDTANAALFPAPDAARFITGTEFVVDGGMIARCDWAAPRAAA